MLPGPSIAKEFESILANHCQKEYAISTCNASTSILGVFLSLGLQNNEIITTPLTWPGAMAGLLALNCKLKFCNVEPEFLTIDPNEIRRLITPETKAVFSADFLGYPCRLDEIKKVCEEYNLLLIHDAASSFGSYYKGYQSGYFADVSVYSFGQKKLFSIGEGGAIVTQREDLYEKLLYGITHPERQQIEYDYVNPISMNISMNLLAAEYGVRVFNKRINYIKNRSKAITGFLKGLIRLNEDDDIQPNYYKVMFGPNQVKLLPDELVDFVSMLPIGVLNTEILTNQENLNSSFLPGEMVEWVNNYRVLDSSIINQLDKTLFF